MYFFERVAQYRRVISSFSAEERNMIDENVIGRKGKTKGSTKDDVLVIIAITRFILDITRRRMWWNMQSPRRHEWPSRLPLPLKKKIGCLGLENMVAKLKKTRNNKTIYGSMYQGWGKLAFIALRNESVSLERHESSPVLSAFSLWSRGSPNIQERQILRNAYFWMRVTVTVNYRFYNVH